MWCNRTVLTPAAPILPAIFTASACEGKLAANERFTPHRRTLLSPSQKCPSLAWSRSLWTSIGTNDVTAMGERRLGSAGMANGTQSWAWIGPTESNKVLTYRNGRRFISVPF